MLLLIFGVCAWNAIVDPYHMYTDKIRFGFNHLKLRNSGPQTRMTKAWQIRRQKPNGLILGMSRADWGLNPNHPSLSREDDRYFNAALPGGTIYEAFRYLQHAHSIRPLQYVMLSLDMEMFVYVKQRDTFEENRLACDVTGHPNRLSPFFDLAPTLFSVSALNDSQDVIHQSGLHTNISEDVLRDRGSDYYEILEPKERWKAYRHGLREAAYTFSHLRDRQDVFREQLKWYRALLQFAYENEIEVKQFITPYHLSHLEAMRVGDFWAGFESWKKALVQVTHHVAQELERPPFEIFDFSGYHPYALAPFPTSKDPFLIMEWYRDSSHYRKILGDRLIEVMVGERDPEPGFGELLTAESVEEVLKLHRELQEKHLDWSRKKFPWRKELYK